MNEARSVQEELEVLARMAEAGLPEEPAADVPAAEEASPMAPEPAPAPAEPPPPAVPIPAEPAPEPAGDRPETPEAPGVEDGDQAVLNALDSLANRVHATERNMEEILSPLEQAVRGLEQQLESLDSDDPGGEGPTALDAPEPIVGLSESPRPATPTVPPSTEPIAAPPPPEPPISPPPISPPTVTPPPVAPSPPVEETPEDRWAEMRDADVVPPRFDPDARRSAAELIKGLDFGQGRGEAGSPAGAEPDPAPPAPPVSSGPTVGAPPERPAFAGPVEPPRPREPAAPPPSGAGPAAERPGGEWPETDILELDQPVEPEEAREPLGGPDRFDRFIPAEDHERDFGQAGPPPIDFESPDTARRIVRALAVVLVLAVAAIGGAAFFVLYNGDGGFMEQRQGEEIQTSAPAAAGAETPSPAPTGEGATLTVPPVEPLGSPPASPQPESAAPVVTMDTPPAPEPAMPAPTPAMPAPTPAEAASTASSTSDMPEPPAEPSLTPSPEVATAISTAPSVAGATAESMSPAPPLAPAQTASLPSTGQPENIEEAVDWLERESQRGESDAQIALATLYAQGTEVEQDYRQAAHWFREAALQGRAEAQFNLGVLHERGLGVQEDPLEALLWYLNAAEQDHVMAQYNLGVAYADGKGVPQDYVEARKWFAKAAERGLSNGQFNLGVLYEEGYGTEKDLVEAYRWYSIADAYGDKEGGVRAREIAQRLSVEDMARATALIETFSVIPAMSQQAAATSISVPASSPGDSSREVVKEIQILLTRLNFDPGPADGIPGDRTVNAIREFQLAAGIDVDGQPTVELLAHMRTVMGE